MGCATMSVWELQGEDEWEFEEEVQRLEGKLARAIESEKYDLAARTRDALFRWVAVQLLLRVQWTDALCTTARRKHVFLLFLGCVRLQ